MLAFDINKINLAQIEYFLTLARVRNYTKAADICCVTQSTISRSMRSLEDYLGIILFTKDINGMRLTPAGKALYKDFERILDDISHSVINANQIQAGDNKETIISFNAYITPQIQVFPYVEKYLEQNPDFRYTYRSTDFLDYGSLMDYSSDIIFDVLCNQILYKDISLESAVLHTHLLSVILSDKNPYQAKSISSLEELRQFEFFFPISMRNPAYENMLTQLFTKAGFTPRIRQYLSSIHECLYNLQNSDAGFIADSYVLNIYNKNYRAINIEDTQSGAIAVWRSSEVSGSPVRRFIDAICK